MRLALLRSQTDERLVALARQGHPRAFEAIVRRYRRQLLPACRRIVPEALASEVLERALGDAWIRVRREEVGELRAWLLGIVRETVLRASGHALVDAVHSRSFADADRRVVVHETLATLARLPERQRATLLRSAERCDSLEALRRARLEGARAVASSLPLRWLGSGGGEPRIAELVYATDGSWRTGKLTERAT
jgi:hypothetical protein